MGYYWRSDLTCRLADIVTTPLPKVKKSPIVPTGVPGQWQMDITWEATTSEAGPATSIFCFYAVDVARYHHAPILARQGL